MLMKKEIIEDNKKLKEEIERLNNIIKEQGLQDKPNYYVKGLEGSLKEYQEEIERLNNVIGKKEQFLGDNIKRLEREVVKRDNIINELKAILKSKGYETYIPVLERSDKE